MVYNVVFVPGGCTGKFQPADVGLQRPLKAFLRNQFNDYLVHSFDQRDTNGEELDIRRDILSTKILKNHWVRWACNAVSEFQHQRTETVTKAWWRCGLMQVLEEDAFEQAIELQLQGKLFEKGSVESLLPVDQAAVSLVEDVEEVVSDFGPVRYTFSRWGHVYIYIYI